MVRRMGCNITRKGLCKARAFIKEHETYDLDDPTMEMRDIHHNDMRYRATNVLKAIIEAGKIYHFDPYDDNDYGDLPE